MDKHAFISGYMSKRAANTEEGLPEPSYEGTPDAAKALMKDKADARAERKALPKQTPPPPQKPAPITPTPAKSRTPNLDMIRSYWANRGKPATPPPAPRQPVKPAWQR
jgi:hypothetical protein